MRLLTALMPVQHRVSHQSKLTHTHATLFNWKTD
jgi:hypothetical protein